MKQAPIKVVKLTDEQVHTIRQAVFDLIESKLPAPFFLLDVEFVKESGIWYLRLYIEKPDFTVSLNDCEQVSRALDPEIDTIKVLQDFPYNLEVSSPGLFRSISSQREFDFYLNRPVRIIREEIAAPVSKNRRLKPAVIEHEIAAGILKSYNAAHNSVAICLDKSQEEKTFNIEADMRVFLNPALRVDSDVAQLNSKTESEDLNND
jgi:ribosome maturation factor RimP